MTVHTQIPLFRPEVLAARKHRLHGEVSLAVPMSWQAISYLLFAAMVVAFAFLGIATYSRVETVAGTIVVDKGTAPMVPTRAGVVAALHVIDGQTVAAGQSLATIRSEEDLASGGASFDPDTKVASVAPGSPAALAGIEDGDILQLLNGMEPGQYAAQRPGRSIWELPAGTRIELTLVRAGIRIEREVTLQDFMEP